MKKNIVALAPIALALVAVGATVITAIQEYGPTGIDLPSFYYMVFGIPFGFMVLGMALNFLAIKTNKSIFMALAAVVYAGTAFIFFIFTLVPAAIVAVAAIFTMKKKKVEVEEIDY